MTEQRKFHQYIIPAIASSLVMASYTMIDGMFVGRGVGSMALASLNIAWPYISLIAALNAMIGIGGGSLASIYLGQNKKDESNNIFIQSLVCALCISFAVVVLGEIFAEPIMYFCGGSDLLMPYALEYFRIYIAFGLVWCTATVLGYFIRNDGNPKLVLGAMIFSGVINIILDYIFIFQLNFGVKGAAFATGIGQTAGLVVLSFHFLFKKGDFHFTKLPLSLTSMGKVIKTGFPSFFSEVGASINVLVFNMVLIRIMDEYAIAAYTVIDYITYLTFYICEGVSMGIQPIISYAYGSNDPKAIRSAVFKGIIINLIIATVAYFTCFFKGAAVASLMNKEADLLTIIVPALKVSMAGIFFSAPMSTLMITLLSTNQTAKAFIVTLCRSLIFTLIFIPLIPFIFGAGAVWTANIFIESATLMVAVIAFITGRKNIFQI